MQYKQNEDVTKEDIDKALDRCTQAQSSGRSVYPNMSYEDGVEAALAWVLDSGYEPYPPFEED